ncbi:MAG: DnaJ domain-containing protein [Candidatus Gastranaerophilales bacterium]|nr:DnaJ domain-containing protein [Candidatus Gastranaerophilales bacterium]
MLKSYYEILNLSPNATKSEIKKQYKKLAKMYHPDINSSLEAELRFKEINKAIEVLLDDEKRKNYDALRTVTKTIYRNTAKEPKEKQITPINGEDITVKVSIDYREALLGTYRVVNIAQSEVCPKCKGRKLANGNKCPLCNGLGEITKNRKITVKIPCAIKNNTKLRLKNEGHEGKFGGKNGNLYVIVNIENENELNIVDETVYYNAQISPYTAILGGDIKVPTLWGEATIKIPPLTKSFQSFKLMNVGILDKKTNKKGDEIVKIIIQIPTSITDEEYNLYKKLKEINLGKKNASILN